MKEILITSSVLILALLVLRLVFAKKVRRSLIYGAWALVALRLLVPVQIGELDFSVLTAAEPVTEAITDISTRPVSGQTKEEVYSDLVTDYIEKDQSVFIPEVQEQIKAETEQGTATKEEIFDKIQQAYPGQEIFLPEVQQQVQQQVEETAAPITLGQIATVVWLSGVAVMAVWFAVVNLRHSRMLRQGRKVLRCQSILPVYVSEKVGSPCLVGLLRPVIYLTPESAASEETMRHVLTHELTHYAHKDHIWSLVRCGCLCVYWFNPLVWAAAWFSRRDCELACDEGALQRLGEEERIAYGKTLLDVVSHAAAHGNLLQTATAMNETKKQLKERVSFIVKKPKLSIIAAVCMVLVCAIVTGCVATGPSSKEETPEAKQTVYLPASYKFTCAEKVDGEPLSIERKFTYDEAGRCIRCESVEEWREGYPSTRIFTFTYDDKGNLIEEIWHSVSTNKDGQVTEGTQRYTYDYIYDDKGRVERSVTTEEYNGEVTVLNAYVFTYDSDGNVITVEERTEGTIRYYYDYDKQGRMVSETRCTTLPENYQPATENNYLYYQRVFTWGENGKVASVYEQHAYSVEEVGLSGLDQLEFKQTTSEFPFYYDDRGNFTGWNEEGQYQYDENGHLILEDRYETIKYRGELIERLVAKYTRDAYGNITGFENEKYREEATYVALELTASEAKAAKQFFEGSCYLSFSCDVGENLLLPVWPKWNYYELLRLIPNSPW